MLKYKINKIEYSIYDKGYWSGNACIRIIFSGCNLECKSCESNNISNNEYTIIKILKEIEQYKCRYIILTGGEPLIQNIAFLVDELRRNNYYVILKTNGTQSVIGVTVNWIIISPKTKQLHRSFNHKAPNEIDYTITEHNPIYKYPFNCKRKYLIPMRNDKTLIRRCVNIIKEKNDWRLSLNIKDMIND